MGARLSLSDAKARLSEVVRAVRTDGEEAIVTVDGEPAVRIVPIAAEPRRLTEAEVTTFRVLMQALARVERPQAPFDAVDLVRDGRR